MAEEGRWIGTRHPVDLGARAERIRVAFVEGRSDAFVVVRGEEIVGNLTLAKGATRLTIGMCLANDIRGRGWGGALLDAAIAHATSLGRPIIALDVYAHNAVARRLYASRGFVAVGDVEIDDRGEGVVFDVITMERMLAGVARRAVIEQVADAILARPHVRRVAVDGTDGAGKTCFAVELAHELMARNLPVVRASVDGFHHPRATRYRRGRRSPLGFFEDSYDYAALRRRLLDPFGAAGSGCFRRAVHDVDSDEAIEDNDEFAPPGTLLVIDGIFLLREELRAVWDYSIFLDVAFAVSIPRGAARDGHDPDSASDANRRYVEGQRIYFERATPSARASIVIDNNDLDAPRIVRE